MSWKPLNYKYIGFFNIKVPHVKKTCDILILVCGHIFKIIALNRYDNTVPTGYLQVVIQKIDNIGKHNIF